MTRLTNQLRKEIVGKIMSNVPIVDYRGKIKEFLNETARSIAPPEIMALHGTPAWQYVAAARVYIPGCGAFWVCPLPNASEDTLRSVHPDPTWRKLYDAYDASGLHDQDKQQNAARRAMFDKLMQVMQSATTIKGLRKVLSPDLHQFVPIDVETTAGLPVPAVVAELKAMGMTFPEPTHGGNQ
jgi:hypothetical protein